MKRDVYGKDLFMYESYLRSTAESFRVFHNSLLSSASPNSLYKYISVHLDYVWCVY